MDQKSLERYIDRVIKLQDERSERLHTDELEAIAMDLGLAIDELYAEVDAHLQRGRGYMSQSLWDDAIKELREAEALAPGRVEVVMTLAEAHANRWEATDFVDDKEHARKLAKSALDLDPNHGPAFELMGRLERGESGGRGSGPSRSAYAGSAQTGGKAGKLIILSIVVFTLFLTLLGGFVGVFVLQTRDDSSGVMVQKFVSPAVVHDTTETPVEPDDSVTFDAPKTNVPVRSTGGERDSRDLELKVSVPHADKIEFEVQKSRLDVYTDSSFYALRAVMKNVSDQELTKIETVLELLDADGKVLHRGDPSLLWGHQPAIRPGDLSPINLTQRASPAVQAVRLTIKLVDGSPGASSYPAGKPVDVKMGASFPSHLNLEVRERIAGQRPGKDGDGYFKATFELENKGETAIKSLKLQLDLYASDGKLLETKTGIVAYSMTPSIQPGQIWLENFIAEVENSYDRYELTVVELE
jgi:hypothetical protein